MLTISPRSSWIVGRALRAWAVVVLCGALLVIRIVTWRAEAATCRAEITELGEQIELRESAASVLERCRTRPGDCDFRCRREGERLLVATPLELGAKNWILVMPVSDEKVTAVQFRMEDSVKMQPAGSPADRP